MRISVRQSQHKPVWVMLQSHRKLDISPWPFERIINFNYISFSYLNWRPFITAWNIVHTIWTYAFQNFLYFPKKFQFFTIFCLIFLYAFLNNFKYLNSQTINCSHYEFVCVTYSMTTLLCYPHPFFRRIKILFMSLARTRSHKYTTNNKWTVNISTKKKKQKTLNNDWRQQYVFVVVAV